MKYSLRIKEITSSFYNRRSISELITHESIVEHHCGKLNQCMKIVGCFRMMISLSHNIVSSWSLPLRKYLKWRIPWAPIVALIDTRNASHSNWLDLIAVKCSHASLVSDVLMTFWTPLNWKCRRFHSRCPKRLRYVFEIWYDFYVLIEQSHWNNTFSEKKSMG